MTVGIPPRFCTRLTVVPPRLATYSERVGWPMTPLVGVPVGVTALVGSGVAVRVAVAVLVLVAVAVLLGSGVGVAVGCGPGPLTLPATSAVPPLASGKRTVTCPPCRTLPRVLPVQVVPSVAVTGPQALLSIPTVVGMKAAAVPPTCIPLGPVALIV